MNPGIGVALRDVALVARFELLRAVRTWQALAVIVLYVVASAGATYLFIQGLGQFENVTADALHVPRTEYPGALLTQLMKGDAFRGMIGAMVGDPNLVDRVLELPILAIFHQWTGLILLPYLATLVSAEAISTDIASRALRFELLRTGRLELVLGRFAGQALLCGIAAMMSAVATAVVGFLFMVGLDPLALAWGLVISTSRTWMYGLPFIGIGLMCSQLTSSPAWGRVLATIATSFTWIGFGLLRWGTHKGYGMFTEPLLPLLPESWVRQMWEGGTSVAIAGTYFVALSIALVALGNAWLSRRDA